MSGLKQSLKLAKESIAGGNCKEALQHCKAALKADKSSYEAYVLIGKAAFLMKEPEKARIAYTKAIDINPELLPAWKGLVELHSAGGENGQLIDALHSLIRLSGVSEGASKKQEYQKKLASALQQTGRTEEAAQVLGELLKGLSLSDPSSLAVMCQLVDLREDLGQKGSDALPTQDDLLQNIVILSNPTAAFSKYHNAWLTCSLARLPKLSEGGRGDWAKERKALLQELLSKMAASLQNSASKPPCCSRKIYEEALSLSDQLQAVNDDESAGGLEAASAAKLSLELAHKFPWSPVAKVLLSQLLFKRMLSNKIGDGKPIRVSAAQRISLALTQENLLKGKSMEGWQTASVLCLLTARPNTAQELAFAAVEWFLEHVGAQEALKCQALSRLQMTNANAMLAKKDPKAAQAAFSELRGEAEGNGNAEWAEKQRLQALEGLARCALAQNELEKAEGYFQNLQKEPGISGQLDGQIKYGFGAVQFNLGRLEEAQQLLEESITAFKEAGPESMESEIGAAYALLGRTLWTKGGKFRSERRFAHRQFLAAAGLEGPSQADAFAWLGTFYAEVAQDKFRAQKCFERAIALDPCQEMAGAALCKMLQPENPEAALKLCIAASRQDPAAIWAWKRQGRLLLKARKFQEAITALQTALKGNEGDADAWEILGAAYQGLGRLTAAVKAYSQATSLVPEKTFSWVQAGTIQLSLAAASDARSSFQEALTQDPDHVPALLGSAEALLGSAQRHIHFGALGRASKELQEAEALAAKACQLRSHLQAAWKSLGDIRLSFSAVPPSSPNPAQHDTALDNSNSSWRGWLKKVHNARACYGRSLHLAPHCANHWADTASALLQQARLMRQDTRSDPQALKRMLKLAARLTKGGLRLNPASAELWAMLGSAVADSSAKEYALSRALQLNPKLVDAWVGLGRLYTASRQTGLASACYAHARSFEPAAAAIWESMGALAALSPSGASERIDFYRHANSLGPSEEALLGFVQGALQNGPWDLSSLQAAASRGVAIGPLNPACHAALGAVLAKRGDFTAAVRAWRKALALLHSLSKDEEGKRVQISTSLQSIAVGAMSPTAAIQINLAKALRQIGSHEEAVSILVQLDQEGVLKDKPAALLALGESQSSAQNLDAAQSAFSRALAAGPSPEVQVEIVRAWCALHISLGESTAAVKLLEKELPQLTERRAPWKNVRALLLATSCGVGRKGIDEDLAAISRQCAKYAVAADDIGGAAFLADRLAIECAATRLRERPRKAAKLAAAAFHICPWDANRLSDTAVSALHANSRAAYSLYRFLPRDSRTDAGEQVLQATAHAALLLPNHHHNGPVLKALIKYIRGKPYDSKAWTNAALIALKIASYDPSKQAFERCRQLAKGAIARTKTESAMQRGLLYCAFTEACLNLHLLDKAEESLAPVHKALKNASDASEGQGVTATVLLLSARLELAEGNVEKAKSGFQKAFEQAPESLKANVAMHFASAALHASRTVQPGNESAALALLTTAEDVLDSVITGLRLLGDLKASRLEALQIVFPAIQGRLAGLLLHKAQISICQSDYAQAVSAAEEAVGLSGPSSCDLYLQQEHDVAQVVLGYAQLFKAMEERQSAPSTAFAALNILINSQQPSISLLSRVLLIRAEQISSHKKKDARIEEHLNEVRSLQEKWRLPPVVLAVWEPYLKSSESW